VQPPPIQPPPPAEPQSNALRTGLVFGGLGVAAAGIGVGTVTGILTLSKAGALKDKCVDGRCPPSSSSDLDTTRTLGVISTVAFVVGGVGALAGAAGFLLVPAAPSTGVYLGPGTAGVRGTF
jgi:hypothetical protein